MSWRGGFSRRTERIGVAFLACFCLAPAVGADATRTGSCQKDRLTIALDIGHDLTHPGATSALGVPEFTYNQALGREAARALQAVGFTRIVLIGESGAPMPLHRRTRIAREAGAAVFVSLHHDSAQKQYFSTWMVDGRALPYSDAFQGYSIFVSTHAAQARESMALAADLGRALQGWGLTPSPHHAEPVAGENRALLDPVLGIYQYNELAVLRGAAMPALLLESGVIVNRREEQTIRAGGYHPRVAAALVDAISRHCARMEEVRAAAR